MEKDIRNDRIRVIAPYNGASLRAGAIKFAWSDLAGAKSYRFTLVSPSFVDAAFLLADTIIPRDSTGRASCVSVALGRGVYQWSVTARNASYQSDDNIFNLVVVDEPATGEDE